MRFVNTYTPDKKLMLEYYSEIVYPHRTIQAVGIFTAAIAMIAAFFFIPSPKIYYICLPVISVFLIAAGITILFSPRLVAASSVAKGESKVTTVSFGDKISVNEYGYEICYDYSDIVSVKESTSLFAISLIQGATVIVKKGAFAIGNERDFRGFAELLAENAKNR